MTLIKYSADCCATAFSSRYARRIGQMRGDLEIADVIWDGMLVIRKTEVDAEWKCCRSASKHETPF